MANRYAGDIHVEGLRELDKALRELHPEFKGEIAKVNRTVAKFVATDARSAAYSLGGTAAHSAPSVRASAGATRAGVSIGGGAYPMAPGAEFGGRGRPTTQQFQPWRGSGDGAGYFLYPSIRRDEERIVTEYTAGMDELLRRAGF